MSGQLLNEQLLTGQSFNEQYQGQSLIKLTNWSENHHDYQFQTGLNIDTVPFNPKGCCEPGGLYFCLSEDLCLWLSYGGQSMVYVRSVTIPDDAKVWVDEENKFKADRIILGERIPIADLAIWDDDSHNLQAVKRNGIALKYIKNQSLEMCLEAIQQTRRALNYVNDNYAEIYLAAMQQYHDLWF